MVNVVVHYDMALAQKSMSVDHYDVILVLLHRSLCLEDIMMAIIIACLRLNKTVFY